MSVRFSDRTGATRPAELSREDAPAALRVALWNAFEPFLFSPQFGRREWRPRLEGVYRFLHWRTDELPQEPAEARARLERWYFAEDRSWYDIYNLCELVVTWLAAEIGEPKAAELFALFNRVLQAEGSPFRFAGGVLTPVSDEREAQAVREVLAHGDRFADAREHLTKALGLLGHKPEPDYRASIRESITAVATTLRILTGHDHADLNEGLREFARSHPFHRSLFGGLSGLYGYRTGEQGLRHALLEEDVTVGFAEAKFMMVACAAFVGFLIARAAR
jgi:hypothetical protein